MPPVGGSETVRIRLVSDGVLIRLTSSVWRLFFPRNTLTRAQLLCSVLFNCKHKRPGYSHRTQNLQVKNAATDHVVSFGNVNWIWILVFVIPLPQRPHAVSRLGNAVSLLKD